MKGITVERPSADRPAFFHSCAGALAGGLLFRRQHASSGNWDKARHGLAFAGNNVLFACLDFAHTAGESLISFAKGDGLSHSDPSGSFDHLR
jgi:hypothetical protein